MVQSSLVAHLKTSDSPSTIAIIGAGYSGSLIATHLLKKARRPLIIKLIERNHEIGRGVAYSTQDIEHLLNVSVGNMSAFPDDPGHLLRWLNYNYTELSPFLPNNLNVSSFIPRQIFGLYIQSILEEAEATTASHVRLERIHDEVVGVEPNSTMAKVYLASTKEFLADRVVLAIGNTLTTPVVTSTANHLTGYFRNAWEGDALTDLDSDGSVLLIGTGLTMVDMLVSLKGSNHRGKIYAVSRRGLLPLSHQPTQPYPSFLTSDNAPTTVQELVQRFRQEVQAAQAQGYDWRAVVDSIRPITQQLWSQLSRTEQARFLRHVTPYWDVHRHRIAPEIGAIVQALLQSGQLTVMAGRIQAYQPLDYGVNVTLKDRKRQIQQVLTVDRMINCTGIQIDYRHCDHPLIAHLREQGLIRPNTLGLGLDSTPEGILYDAQGQASPYLYTIGTPRKGDLWETIAVPEIRVQAQHLATTILQSLPLRMKAIPPLSREQPVPTILTERGTSDSLLFRQFFDPESSTYTYLIADRHTKEAVFVDTVLEKVERDLQTLTDLGLTLRYCLETHIHADHITGAGQLRQQTGSQVIVPQYATAKSADHSLADGDTLTIGSVQITAIATPGHTNAHLAYWINKTHLLTGDALLIRGCGRTDLQSGDAGTLYDTVTQRLLTLPDEVLVYPAHDYQGRTVSTIGEEKRFNVRFNDRTREQFITIMNNLGLSYPKKINQAVPANQYCGDFIPEVEVNIMEQAELLEKQEKVKQNVATNEQIYDDAHLGMYI
jgi:uncharacterized NAD(P)/FAD-binding protein YdhS/glyoxylase-like metal-dependent hydrolase (beta-lactamase superfamily II)